MKQRVDGVFVGVLIALFSALTILAIAHHPVATSHSATKAIGEIVSLGRLDRVVHGSVIAIIAGLIFAFLFVASRLGLTRPAVLAGLVGYTIGACAMIGAALIDGFLVPDIAARVDLNSPAAVGAAQAVLLACALTIQIATKLGVIAMSAGVALWSIALVRMANPLRLAGIIGLASAALAMAVLFLMGSTLTPHSVELIVIAQALWYLTIATLLIRGEL